MKRGILLGLIILFLVAPVYSLSVELSFPVNNAVYVDSNNIVFKCKAVGEDLRFIELYSNFGSAWSKKAEAQNPTSNTDVIFSLKNISNGDYLWNCKAIDGVEGVKFSSSNRSFSVNLAPNNPPAYKGGLTNSYSWNMNTERKNVFDLDDYFSDPDGNKLSYSVSGNNNIGVSIDANNFVSFSSPNNWFGTEKIYFIATDGKENINSDQINLTVIKTTTNTGNNPPTIDPKIPDQNISLETETWFIDLGNYGKDSEDLSSKLTWYVDGVSPELLKVEIDNTLKRAKLTSKGKSGVDTISFTVSDSNNQNASQSLKVIINENPSSQNSSNNNEFSDIEEIEFKINSITPEEQNILLKENEIAVFKIETSRKGDYEWYLNNELTIEAKNYFSFNSNSEGEFNLTVYASDLDSLLANSWNIVVKKDEINLVAETKPVCGNNIAEQNENCSNCPSDIKCSEEQTCENNICINKKGLLSITGNIIVSLKNDLLKTTGYVLVSILLVLVISILVIRKRNKHKYTHLTTLEARESFIKKIQRRLREIYENKKESKEKEGIKITPSSQFIMGFIKDSLLQGHSKRVIKRALRKNGWGRFKIWKAFRKI